MKKLIYITLFIFLCSCQKNDSQTETTSDTYISFNLSYEDNDNSEISSKIASNNSLTNIDNYIEQISYISLEDNNMIEISLRNESKAHFSKPRILQGNIGNNNGLKAVQSPLPTGIRYRIVVYNQSGDYVTEKLYTVGSESAESERLFLPENSTYTFIFLSYNSASVAPPVVGSGSLSSKTISSISGDYDLMYIRVVRQLVKGSNVLNAVFSHKFARITVVLDATEFISGDFGSISTPSINPHSSNVSLNLSNGNLTYSTPNVSKSLTSLTSTTRKRTYSALVATQSRSDGTVTFGSVNFNGKTSALSATGLNIRPGERYTLTLKLKTTYDTDNLIWAPANLDYNSNTGVYSFAANQSTPGRYFSYYKMLPVNQVTVENNPVGDPCNQMGSVNGQIWRLPTENEMKDLNNSQSYGPIINSAIQQINGTNGVLFTNGLFLGMFGYHFIDLNDGTSTTPTLQSYGSLAHYVMEHRNSYDYSRVASLFLFGQNTSYPNGYLNISIYPIGDLEREYSQARYGNQIRCVRSK